MSQINVSNLTFCYDGSYDNIFENVSFCIDTDWKLGFIGRNGRGKTTFLRLLMSSGAGTHTNSEHEPVYEYSGSISGGAHFEYFPYHIGEDEIQRNTIDIVERIYPDYELWKICRELDLQNTDAELLYRPFYTLSHGERTKVMLAVLFSRDTSFLLIDEPTNHLDMPARELVCSYLQKKQGFILISHDRAFMDECIDHVLVLNRSSITVEKGNFSSWWENKQKRDDFERTENEKLHRDIDKLQESARRTREWAEKAEKTKIGYDPIKEHERCNGTRAYIGEKSRRMEQRRKNLERRQDKAIEEKSGLLKDIEEPNELKLMPIEHHKQVYIMARELKISYKNVSSQITKQSNQSSENLTDYEDIYCAVANLNMELKKGDRIVLEGKNGCGKSSLLKAILSSDKVCVVGNVNPDNAVNERILDGELGIAKDLIISYINQDTSQLRGSLDSYIERTGADNSLFRAILRQLDFERVQFEKNMEEYSEGQKKKVLITGSILKQAHLYIWDEPLNYIDVFSRMQIENLILRYQPTMLIVEHDKVFAENVATKVIHM